MDLRHCCRRLGPGRDLGLSVKGVYDRAGWAKSRASAPVVVASAEPPPADNVERLARMVRDHIALAAGKDQAQAEAHLIKWADWMDDQARLLKGKRTPLHLEGLNAFDLANARDQLLAAIPGDEGGFV
jgi:hypothetical protein